MLMSKADEERRDEILRRALSTPPKPKITRQAKRPKAKKKPAK